MSISHVIRSVAHSYTTQWPISGSANSASNSCPNAVTSVKNKKPNPTKTNQCAIPTCDHCSIRVWPRVSLSIVTQRRPGWSVRPTAGWPVRTTATI